MKLVIFGLSLSSSWGNGHATIWRGLCRALSSKGHRIVFFEKDVPYYSAHRDLTELKGVELILYPEWDDVLGVAKRRLLDADAAVVTSYCPDALSATDLVTSSRSLKVFYDLDSPVTLARLSEGAQVDYVGARGLRDFDLVFSYTGGAAIEELRTRLGAKKVEPLYGSADPDLHRRVDKVDEYRADLSYLGAYAADRQKALKAFFIEPSRRLENKRFVLGGSLYPVDFPWTQGIFYLRHVTPPMHPAFYSSSSFTLNVTRGAMARMGYCPSGRLFEAAACATPVISDKWEGIEGFFTPGSEIITVNTTQDVVDALAMTEDERLLIARRARERTLDEHTSSKRAGEFERILEKAVRGL